MHEIATGYIGVVLFVLVTGAGHRERPVSRIFRVLQSPHPSGVGMLGGVGGLRV